MHEVGGGEIVLVTIWWLWVLLCGLCLVLYPVFLICRLIFHTFKHIGFFLYGFYEVCFDLCEQIWIRFYFKRKHFYYDEKKVSQQHPAIFDMMVITTLLLMVSISFLFIKLLQVVF